jgi:hypothetical protein
MGVCSPLGASSCARTMAFSGAFEGEAGLHGLGWDETGLK